MLALLPCRSAPAEASACARLGRRPRAHEHAAVVLMQTRTTLARETRGSEEEESEMEEERQKQEESDKAVESKSNQEDGMLAQEAEEDRREAAEKQEGGDEREERNGGQAVDEVAKRRRAARRSRPHGGAGLFVVAANATPRVHQVATPAVMAPQPQGVLAPAQGALGLKEAMRSGLANVASGMGRAAGQLQAVAAPLFGPFCNSLASSAPVSSCVRQVSIVVLLLVLSGALAIVLASASCMILSRPASPLGRSLYPLSKWGDLGRAHHLIFFDLLEAFDELDCSRQGFIDCKTLHARLRSGEVEGDIAKAVAALTPNFGVLFFQDFERLALQRGPLAAAIVQRRVCRLSACAVGRGEASPRPTAVETRDRLARLNGA